MKEEIRRYLSKIGKKGGKKSKRVLSSEEAKEMVRRRWEIYRNKLARDGEVQSGDSI